MILSLLLLIIITAGGFSLTYLIERKGPFMWRLAAGNVIGTALFGVVCFFLSLLIGFGFLSISVAALLVFALVGTLKFADDHTEFNHDWDKAKGRIERFTFGRVKSLAYYVFFIVLFAAFFDRAMIVTDAGIFTGASNNLGDLPFHLGTILGFSDGNNFPPQNPSFSGAKFTYPFIADFLTSCLVKLGADVKSAMLLQNVTWAFALLVIFERFTVAITKSRLAGKLAPFILFFSGGLGFVWFFRDYWQGAQGFIEILWNLPRDYTIGDQFRWGNSMVVLFITQRSILLGMPLTIVVIHHLWTLFSGDDKETKADQNRWTQSLYVGFAAGVLPLIHAHSLFVLFIISAFLFFLSLGRLKNWIAFAVGTSVVAIPPLLWMLSGSATNTSEFIAWHIGFDSRGMNLIWFWAKNTGVFIPLAIAGLIVVTVLPKLIADKAGEDAKTNYRYVLFALPFFVLFLVSNLAKFAPWEWDNIKILIYWFVGFVPFAAFAIAYFWKHATIYRIAAGVFLAGLIGAGALDVWRTASSQMEYQVFDDGAVQTAEAIRDRTRPNALFLNAPTYNTAVVLSGRRSLMRYIGHLSSHGIDFAERHSDLKKIYSGEAMADILIRKYGIEYVLISPLERKELTVNEEYFARKELFIESGDYKVYRVAE
jgi:hypothetical protein